MRLAKYVIRELDLDGNTLTYVWSDSSCTIDRLRNPVKYPRAIENLVKKTRGQFPVRHICTEQNPADIASRGMAPSELAS